MSVGSMIGNVPISSIYGFWRSSPFCRTCVSGMSIFVNFWPEFYLLRPKCRQLTENVKEAHKDAIQALVAQCFLTFQTSAVTTGRSGSSKLFLFALLLAILYSLTLGSTTIVPHYSCTMTNLEFSFSSESQVTPWPSRRTRPSKTDASTASVN